jgi:hypothetical protein
MSDISKLPIWKEKYEKLGVTPRELYMRQNGLCWLKPIPLPDGSVKIFCTDGEDEAETQLMLNPTIECAKCMAGFAARVIEIGIKDK